MEKTSRFNLIYLLIAIGGVLIVQEFWMGSQVVDSIAYSDFQTLVRDGQIKEIAIAANEIRGELKNPKANQKRYFKTVRVDVDLAQELAKYEVKFSGKLESMLLPTLIGWIAPT